MLRFLFGGFRYPDKDTYTGYGDVWVLSLPGFHWFKAEKETIPRIMHECTLIGKRQMVSIGGLNYDITSPDRNSSDSWHQGIGIFDLPSLTWSDSYNAHAEDYDSPDVVKAWYQEGYEWSFILFFILDILTRAQWSCYMGRSKGC